MFSGDSLSVLLFLLGTALAAMMGAITAPHGWRSKALWALCGVFTLATLGWLFAPSASPLIQALQPIAASVVQSGALVMVGTVGIVALMQGGQKAPTKTGTDFAKIEVPKAPKFAAYGDSKWKPDVTLQEAMLYLGKTARWRRTKHNMNFNDVQREVLNSLCSGKLTAWAKEHPDHGEYHQVRNTMWGHADISAETGSAFFPAAECSGYDICLAKGELEAAYPRGD